MNLTTRLLLLLTISGLLFIAGCGQQPSTDSTTPPNANHLVKFNEEGIAVLRGRISSGGYAPPSRNGNLKETLKLEVPVKVDGIKTGVAIPFTLRFETEISSSLTPQTNVREYHKINPYSATSSAFPAGVLVDVTFRKKEAIFEVVSIHEVTQKFLFFQKSAVIDNMLSTDAFSQGVIVGSVIQSSQTREGEATWTVSIPIDMHGIEVGVLLLFHSSSNTQVITSDGVVPYTSRFSWERVEMEFTRSGNKLTARQITEIP